MSSLETGLKHRRTSVSVHGLGLIVLTFQTLGIIYSDIGTSPLYVLNGIWPASQAAPSEEDIIGGVSAIIWSLTLLPLIKYVGISLQFGTLEGEGGSFALWQGIYPKDEKDDNDRTLTGDSLGKVTTNGSRFKQAMRWPLLVWSLFGTALTLADGVFTPAVSVTSAVGGIAVAKPSVSDNIVPISIAFLVVLFLSQRFGTSGLGSIFAPISLLWFFALMGNGIYNITLYPEIFRAFDPSRAVLLFIRTKNYDLLAGILLAVTGCEAIFANLGQFNALSIRLSFTCLVYPSLVLAYLGQGARLILDGPNVIQNVFYKSIPGPENGGLFWVIYVLAILATLVASQAMITATFSLFQQIINMKSFPPLRMIYTSEKIQGQVYIPAVNWSLMIVTIIIVAVFSDLSQLTNAYGFSVSTVMLSTTVLLTVQMLWVKHLPVIIALGFLLAWGFFDGLFWGAALRKIPHGAWVPLMFGVILVSIMVLWTWARGLEDTFDGANRQNLRHFLFRDVKSTSLSLRPGVEEVEEEQAESDDENELESATYYISTLARDGSDEKNDRQEIIRIPTMAVFHKLSSGRGVPHTFVGLTRQWRALPEVLVFLSVDLIAIAHVPFEDRFTVTKVKSMDGFYAVTYNIGFRDDFDVKVDELLERVYALELALDPRNAPRIIENIKKVSRNATHIVPHYDVSSRKIEAGYLSFILNGARKFLIEAIYRRLATMFPETANWLTSADEIIHVGINAVI
ncbi:potassium transporter [Dendrothele bispora CBS 962.96]|uniref:Potassium transporter n=1 Tax=Dendrothele bispora (strain CBS 962.96) TaxID=1314807 RepID=A0A4S8MK31_DENBC|nr:potassium transporter [Dendrothele bispora CBS 962.96]